MKNLKSILPSVRDLFFLVPFSLIPFAWSAKLLVDGDTAFQIRLGQAFLRGEVPLSGAYPFTFHTGLPPLITPDWLAAVIMGFVYSVLGLGGIVILFSFLIAISLYLLFLKIRQESNLFLAALMTVIALPIMSTGWLARPYLFSFLMLIIFYKLIDDHQYRENRNSLYALPFLMLLWANLHGGFIVGILLIGLYLTGNVVNCLWNQEIDPKQSRAKIKRLAIILLLCIFMAMITPNGPSLLMYPFGIQGSRIIIDHSPEFESPDFHEFYAWPFVFLLFLVFIAQGCSKKRLNPTELILVLFFSAMSFYSGRHMVLFAIIAAPTLARHIHSALGENNRPWAQIFRRFSENLERIGHSKHIFLWPAAGTIATFLIVVGGHLPYRFPLEPYHAIQFLKQDKIPGNLFNDAEFGDYLVFEAWPEYRIFIDSRGGVYGDKIMRDFLKVMELDPSWQDVIAKYDINFFFLRPDSALSTLLLEKSSDWKLIYATKEAYIFIRNSDRNSPWIKKYAAIQPLPPSVWETGAATSY